MSSKNYSYEGNELDIFYHAKNWKTYFSQRIRPHLKGNVLEVGGGIGGTTRILCNDNLTSWTILEPDAALSERMRCSFVSDPLPVPYEIHDGTVASMDPARKFDSIVYIDVLEHIPEDRQEIRDASTRLNPGGTLVVLSPANPSLYSEFDAAVGHCRRYTRQSLAEVVNSESLRSIRLEYLDSVGCLTSVANRWMLHSKEPTISQITFWDRFLLPCSKLVDPLVRFSFGRSILGIWKKL